MLGFSSELFPEQEEWIQCIAFDDHGHRCATCSSDKRIRIWDKDADGQWHVTASWASWHSGTVWKVAWSPAMFGPLLASFSSDKLVHVWQEPGVTRESKTDPTTEWLHVTSLADHRDVVLDLAFAPARFGVRLATACRDGQVRVFEAKDTLSLERWEPPEVFEGGGTWNARRAAGKEDSGKEAGPTAVTCLCWDPGSVNGATQALLAGCEDGTVRVWTFQSEARKWEPALELLAHRAHVRTVNWAPGMGRSFALLATGAADAKIHVVRLKAVPGGTLIADSVFVLSCPSEVARLQWNVTGTTLASSGDDGNIRLWKQTTGGVWDQVQALSA